MIGYQNGCQIRNNDGARVDGLVQVVKADDENPVAFTAATSCKLPDESSLIALGTSSGQIYLVDKKYDFDIAGSTTDSQAITGLSFDPATGLLAVGTSTGNLEFFTVDSKD